jgi:transposase
LRGIVRRDSGETYQEFLVRLAQPSGIETPTRADLARFDRKRPTKGRNSEWRHPHDPDARITKMKDGRTHLAHKVEHAVDLETGAILSVTVQGADQGDTTTIAETVTAAAEDLEAVASVTDGHTTVIEEVVATRAIAAIRYWSILRARPADLYRGTGSRSSPMEDEDPRARCHLRGSPADPRGLRPRAATPS